MATFLARYEALLERGTFIVKRNDGMVSLGVVKVM